MTYPAIVKTLLLMERCNGGINCFRTEKQALTGIDIFLTCTPYFSSLGEIDAWFAKQTEDDLVTIVDGEAHYAAALTKDAPPFTDKLLEDFFDGEF